MARVLAVLTVVGLLVGCGGGGATAVQLPRCGKPPSPSSEAPPPGAVLPPEARMTAVRSAPPLTQLNAYVERSPSSVRDWIEDQPDLDVLQASPPGAEIELLVTDGVYNTWMSARAICAGASVLAEVIADADAGAELPPVRSGQGEQQ